MFRRAGFWHGEVTVDHPAGVGLVGKRSAIAYAGWGLVHGGAAVLVAEDVVLDGHTSGRMWVTRPRGAPPHTAHVGEEETGTPAR